MALLIGACASHALPPAGELPTRLVVLPAGDEVRGRDGRAWSVKDRAILLAQLNERPVLLDENHASVHAAPRGGASPACGWLSDFKWTDAGLDAASEWTPWGAELFSKKAYRFLSPALQYDTEGASPTVLGTIRGLHSVGLVNDPNLDLPALNAREPGTEMTPEQIKLLTDAIAASIAGGFAAFETKLLALVPAKPEVVADPAPNASKETVLVAVNAIVDAAVTAGKIAPASKAAYVAIGGETPDSLKGLQTLVSGLPVIVSANAAGITPPKDEPAALSAAQKSMCAAMGVTEAEFRKSRSELS